MTQIEIETHYCHYCIIGIIGIIGPRPADQTTRLKGDRRPTDQIETQRTYPYHHTTIPPYHPYPIRNTQRRTYQRIRCIRIRTYLRTYVPTYLRTYVPNTSIQAHKPPPIKAQTKLIAETSGGPAVPQNGTKWHCRTVARVF